MQVLRLQYLPSQKRECLRQYNQLTIHYIYLPSQEREYLRQNDQVTTALFTTLPITRESACVRMTSLTTALFTTPPKSVLASEWTAWQQHYSLHLPRVCLRQNNQVTTALFTTLLTTRESACVRTAWQQHYSLHLQSQVRVLASEWPGDYSTLNASRRTPFCVGTILQIFPERRVTLRKNNMPFVVITLWLTWPKQWHARSEVTLSKCWHAKRKCRHGVLSKSAKINRFCNKIRPLIC